MLESLFRQAMHWAPVSLHSCHTPVAPSCTAGYKYDRDKSNAVATTYHIVRDWRLIRGNLLVEKTTSLAQAQRGDYNGHDW